MAATAPMPALFIGHGSPLNALQLNRYTEAWLRLGATLPRPRAILAISAHWFGPGSAVTAGDSPRTIHDFSGFPPDLFLFNYPAPGDPALAARVQQLLGPTRVESDHAAGLDHGTWSVLAHLYPAADLPVVQLRIDASEPPAWHYATGRRLAALRDEGVLILGSGNIVHNLGTIVWQRDAPAYDWAATFDNDVRHRILRGDHSPLIDYAALGPEARLAVPTPEHYLPLLYVLALQGTADTVTFPVDGIDLGSIGMRSVLIGGA